MEFQKIVNLLDTISGNKDFMINHKEITMLINKLELKHQC